MSHLLGHDDDDHHHHQRPPPPMRVNFRDEEHHDEEEEEQQHYDDDVDHQHDDIADHDNKEDHRQQHDDEDDDAARNEEEEQEEPHLDDNEPLNDKSLPQHRHSSFRVEQDEQAAVVRTAPYLIQPEKLLRVGDVSNTAVVKGSPIMNMRPSRGDSSLNSAAGGSAANAKKRRLDTSSPMKQRNGGSGSPAGATRAASFSSYSSHNKKADVSSSSAGGGGGSSSPHLLLRRSASSSAMGFNHHRKRIEEQLAAIEKQQQQKAAASSPKVVPEKLRRVSPFRSGWCQSRPTDEEQLAHAEKVIMSPLRGRYVQQTVRGLNTVSFTPPDHILDALHTLLQKERADMSAMADESNNSEQQHHQHHTPVTLRHLIFVHGMGGGVGTWLPNLKHFADLADLLNSAVVFGNDEQEPNDDEPSGSEEEDERESSSSQRNKNKSSNNESKHDKIFQMFLGEIDEIQRQKLVHQRKRREFVIVHALDLPGYARSMREDVDFESAHDSTEYMLESLCEWAEAMEFNNVALWVSTRLPKIPMVAAKKKKRQQQQQQEKTNPNSSSSATKDHEGGEAEDNINVNNNVKKKNDVAAATAEHPQHEQQQHQQPRRGGEELRDASSVRRRGSSSGGQHDDEQRHHQHQHENTSSSQRRRSNSPSVGGGGVPVLWHGHGASTRSNASSNNSNFGGSENGGGGGRSSRSHTPANVRIGGAPFKLLSDRRAAKLMEAEKQQQQQEQTASVNRVMGSSSIGDDEELVDCDDDVFDEEPPAAALAGRSSSNRQQHSSSAMPPLSPPPASNPRFILPDSPEHLNPNLEQQQQQQQSAALPRPGSPGYASFFQQKNNNNNNNSSNSPSPHQQRRSATPPIGILAARQRKERRSSDAMRASSVSESQSEFRRTLRSDKHDLEFEPPIGIRIRDDDGENDDQHPTRFSNVTVLAHSYGAYLFGHLACWGQRFKHGNTHNDNAAAAAADDDNEPTAESSHQVAESNKKNKKRSSNNNNIDKKISGNWIDHLVLLDPWGLPPSPPEDDAAFHANVPCLFRCLAGCFTCCDVLPLSALRKAGPWGPSLLKTLRGDFSLRWEAVVDDVRVFHDYCYHCNAQDPPTGERAIKRSTEMYGFSSDPLGTVMMEHCPDSMHVTFLFGDKTFMAKDVGFEVTEVLRARRAEQQNNNNNNNNTGVLQYSTVPMAGHQLNTDNVFAFNSILQALLKL